MQKSSYTYRGYITYTGGPSLPFELNQADNVMGRTIAEFSRVPSFTVEKNSSLNPMKDDRKLHHETSAVYGGPVEELISKIMDDVNLHSTVSPSTAAVNVAGQPHDSPSPTEICDGDYCYYTNKGRQQPDANYVRNEKIDDSDTAIDQNKTPSTGSWARPTRPTWPANTGIVVKLGEPAMNVGNPVPSTFLGSPTARGNHYNQSEKKPVLSIHPESENYDDYSRRGQLANKPSMPNTGGSIWPHHVSPSSFKVRASQPIESTNIPFKLMEPKKEVTKPVSLSTSPSTGLYGATSRGELLNQKEVGKRVAHITPQHDSYNVNLRNDSGRKPALDILGGYPKPSHVMGATLPGNKAQLGESPNYRGGSLEPRPPKEYGKPASVTAALPMDHNNASGHTGMQPNDVRKPTLPFGDGTHGISPSSNNNGNLKETAKASTPTAIASGHPTGLNGTAGRNGLEEHRPVGNNSWGDRGNDYQNRRHGPPAPTTNNNGEWTRSNPPRAVSLSATGPKIGESVTGSKEVEPLNDAAKPTPRPAAPPEPKYNLVPSPVQKKEPSDKTMDSGEAPRRYGNLDTSSQQNQKKEPKYNLVPSPVQKKESSDKTMDSGEAPRRYGNLDTSSQQNLQTGEKTKGSIDSREAARKYRGMQIGNR